METGTRGVRGMCAGRAGRVSTAGALAMVASHPWAPQPRSSEGVAHTHARECTTAGRAPLPRCRPPQGPGQGLAQGERHGAGPSRCGAPPGGATTGGRAPVLPPTPRHLLICRLWPLTALGGAWRPCAPWWSTTMPLFWRSLTLRSTSTGTKRDIYGVIRSCGTRMDTPQLFG